MARILHFLSTVPFFKYSTLISEAHGCTLSLHFELPRFIQNYILRFSAVDIALKPNQSLHLYIYLNLIYSSNSGIGNIIGDSSEPSAQI